MRYKIIKRCLIFWCMFIGLGALYGSIMMFIDPTGKLLQMDGLIKYFQVLPFSDVLFKNYIFSGISLLIVNGITNFIATYYLIKNKKAGPILGMIFGFTLILWIIIQFIIFPTNILSITYFIFGIIQLLTGYMTYIFYHQAYFKFDINEYQNIGTNKNILVVYFSRLGYTKRTAYEKANEIGADILELTTKERTKDTLGFLWCGRFGMHKWGMPIEPININIKSYKKIIIVSPIWVFDVSAPIREFCTKYKNDINEVEYIVTHYMKAKFMKVADNLDKIIGKKRLSYTSISVRLGKVKKIMYKGK